jgi:hypothetical protein
MAPGLHSSNPGFEMATDNVKNPENESKDGGSWLFQRAFEPKRCARAIFLNSCFFLLATGFANAESVEVGVDAIPPADVIIQRVAAARAENRARVRSFEVLRTYQLFGKEGRTSKSEISADISYAPGGFQDFSIHKVAGVAMGETIVRKILESEKEVLANPSATDISEDNYRFRFLRSESLDGRPCYALELQPKRRDTKLLAGTMWVDAATYLILKVEGHPAQPPSWWVHNIHVTLRFEEVHGMWLQTGFRSTADVRLLGPHLMVSHDVEYKMGEIEAAILPAH